MPLVAIRLSASIKSKLLADADSHAVDNAALTALCKAVGEAVVEELTANATVLPVGLPLPFTAPPGVAGGPVTGTGTIT